MAWCGGTGASRHRRAHGIRTPDRSVLLLMGLLSDADSAGAAARRRGQAIPTSGTDVGCLLPADRGDPVTASLMFSRRGVHRRMETRLPCPVAFGARLERLGSSDPREDQPVQA